VTKNRPKPAKIPRSLKIRFFFCAGGFESLVKPLILMRFSQKTREGRENRRIKNNYLPHLLQFFQ
jgi:hypothetical protein